MITLELADFFISNAYRKVNEELILMYGKAGQVASQMKNVNFTR